MTTKLFGSIGGGNLQVINAKDKKAIILLMIFIITATVFKTVFYKGSANETVDNKKEIIHNDLEMILDAFSNEDKHKLLELFSQRSHSSNDLDSQIDKALLFFDGNIISHKEPSTPCENTSTKRGKVIRSYISISSTIKTDAGHEYKLTFSDCIVFNGSNQNEETGIMYITLRDEKDNIIYIGDSY